MRFKEGKGLESGGPFSPSRPLPWDLPHQACGRLRPSPRPVGDGPWPPTRLCTAGWEQRGVWVGPAALRPELRGPQASVNRGAGQTPGPSSGSLPASPPWPARPALNKLLTSPCCWAGCRSWGTCPPRSSASLPFLFLARRSPPSFLLPVCPALLHEGQSRGPWGSQGTRTQAGDPSWGPFFPNADKRCGPGQGSRPSSGQEWALRRDDSPPVAAAWGPGQQERRRGRRTKPTTVCLGPVATLGSCGAGRIWPRGQRWPCLCTVTWQPLHFLLLQMVTVGAQPAERL